MQMPETSVPMTTAMSETWTIGRVLQWATDDFRGRGIQTARLDAELLLSHTLGVDRIKLITDSTRPLTPDELAAYRKLIVRRRRFEPIAYLLGRREFYGLDFRVDARVLVPRPETELLVETALARTLDRSQHGRALDLCTGSGCVAIALAKQRPTWQILGTDISADALEVARTNAQRLGAIWGVRFVQSDLFANLPDSAQFDLISANPPYIPAAELAGLQADVRDFEPRLALDGGEDGLSIVRRVLEQAREHLTQGAILAIEVGHDQGFRVATLFEEQAYTDVELRRDYAGYERVISGRWVGKVSP